MTALTLQSFGYSSSKEALYAILNWFFVELWTWTNENFGFTNWIVHQYTNTEFAAYAGFVWAGR